MKRIDFLPEAENDLDSMWDYTAENWGRDQANRYTNEIRAVIVGLADGRKTSSSAAVLREGLRKVPVARHVVFFREVGEVIEVVRVLRERMDVGRV